MTTEHEALARTRKRVLRWYGAMHAGGHKGFYADVEALEAAIRAQVDEDVRRLVEAAQPFANLTSCYCEDYWRNYGRKHGPNCVVDDLEYEIAGLRAALEPFKAVAPTADAEEGPR